MSDVTDEQARTIVNQMRTAGVGVVLDALHGATLKNASVCEEHRDRVKLEFLFTCPDGRSIFLYVSVKHGEYWFVVHDR